MGIMDDVITGAKQTATTIGKKSAEFYDFAKLKVLLAETKSNLSKKYEALGKITYEAEKSGAFADTTEIIVSIDILKEKITELEDKLAEHKNFIRCESCDAYNTIGSKFCNDCGASFNIASKEDDDDFNADAQ